jgi:hypothetical protein
MSVVLVFHIEERRGNNGDRIVLNDAYRTVNMNQKAIMTLAYCRRI